MLLRRLARGARAAKTWQRTRAAQARAPATRGATSLAQQQHQQQQLVERQEQHHGDELEHLFSAGSSQVRGMQEETEAQGKQLAAQAATRHLAALDAESLEAMYFALRDATPEELDNAANVRAVQGDDSSTLLLDEQRRELEELDERRRRRLGIGTSQSGGASALLDQNITTTTTTTASDEDEAAAAVGDSGACATESNSSSAASSAEAALSGDVSALQSLTAPSALAMLQLAVSRSKALSSSQHTAVVRALVQAGEWRLATRHIYALERSGKALPQEAYADVMAYCLDPARQVRNHGPTTTQSTATTTSEEGTGEVVPEAYPASALTPIGWNLYAHMRLVAHPTPSREVYTLLLAACARGRHPAPERARDLFHEMTVDNRLPPDADAYAAVIRACARVPLAPKSPATGTSKKKGAATERMTREDQLRRDGTERAREHYHEALRLLREMLDNNLEPNTATLNAVLEGCRAHADLARARWILARMAASSSSSSPSPSMDKGAPTASTIALVLQTYAHYAQHLPPSLASATSPEASTKLGEDSAASYEFPGPMPRTRREALKEVLLVIRRMFGDEVHATLAQGAPDLAKALRDEQRQQQQQGRKIGASKEVITAVVPSSVAHSVHPTVFLVNALMEASAALAGFAFMRHVYNVAFAAFGVSRNARSFEIATEKAEHASLTSREAAFKFASEDVFPQWRDFMQARSRQQQQQHGGALQEGSSEEGGTSLPVARAGQHIGKMYSSLIRHHALHWRLDQAMDLLREFARLFPASALRTPDLPQPVAPPPLIDASSQAVHTEAVTLAHASFPETSPPEMHEPLGAYILSADVMLLHMRLRVSDDEAAVDEVRKITSEYERQVFKVRRASQRKYLGLPPRPDRHRPQLAE